jgi:hypothetical protein
MSSRRASAGSESPLDDVTGSAGFFKQKEICSALLSTLLGSLS